MKNTGNKQVIPLYNRIESQIRNKIISGQYEPGEQLPTEDELVRQLRVSKITVRKAMSHLETDGLIVRSQGKGTFVSEGIPAKKQLVVSDGVYGIVRSAEKYEVKTLDIRQVKVGTTRVARDIRDFLNLSNEDDIGLIRRIRLMKDIPIAFFENFLPLDFAKHLTVEGLAEQPLLKILKEKVGLAIGRGEMYIEAVPADADIAEILHCQIYDPLVSIQVYYWLSSDEPFEIVNLHMRAEYFKYKIDLNAEGFENI